nr:hypothetical protein [Tanacetum cinerariifolium]
MNTMAYLLVKGRDVVVVVEDECSNGFAAVLAVLTLERLKADRARKSHQSPTKSLFDVGSSRIFIFTVITYVSLRCSGNTTWLMRMTLISVLLFIMCEEASKVESCPSDIILDDLLALDSIVRFDLGDRRLEQTATFSISTNSE